MNGVRQIGGFAWRLGAGAGSGLMAGGASKIGHRRSNTPDALRDAPLFFGLTKEALEEIAGQMQRVHLAGGDVLFRRGDRGDSVYVVLHGRLRVVVTSRTGDRVIREVGRGENVGELALLTGERRSATVQAVRDSVLARWSREAFLQLAEKHPSAILQLTRILAAWLVRSNERDACGSSAVATVAVLPRDRHMPVASFCEKLARELARFGPAAVITSETVEAALGRGAAHSSEGDPGNDTLAQWLDTQESQHRFLVYQADRESSAWTRRCVRQADRTLHVASLQQSSPPARANDWLGRSTKHSSVSEELVLLRERGAPQRTREWLGMGPFSRHHHVRFDRVQDFQRLARHLAGRAVGLVLGSGGARGFAHIGVIRALEEAGVPIDRIGGTSMGAVIAAQYAQGFGPSDLLAINREHWIGVQPLRDFTVPLISLLSGRKGTRMLERMFGDTRIEDLPLNYYCVSASLTRAESVVHRTGRLRDWIRASISIPGIAPPFVTESGELLVDGAVLDGLPTDAMHGAEGGIVIAVNVSPRIDLAVSGRERALPSPWRTLWQSISPSSGGSRFPTIFQIMQRTAHLGAMQHAKGLRDRVDLYLEPPVGHYDTFDWSAIDAIAETGYRTTLQTIETWRSGEPFMSVSKEGCAR